MRQILNIAYYEIRYIFKDSKLVALIFMIPLLYATVFGFVYANGILNHIPLAIVDLDNSKLSREVTTAFANSPHFKTVASVQNYQQFSQAMRDGTVRAGIVIPEHFAAKVRLHQATQVQAVFDASNLVFGYNTRKYMREVMTDFNTRHTASYLAGLGIGKNQLSGVLNTVNCNYEVWYNPTFSYITYFYLGLLLMVIHQNLLSIGLTVTREKEKHTWIHYLCSPLPTWQIFVGKALPYFIMNYFNYVLLLWIAAYFVQAKIAGSLGLLLVLGLCFAVIITSLGFVISLRAPNSLQVTRYLMLLSVPFMMISGYTWPSTHIPTVVNALARLLPFTWMAEAVRLVTVKGLPAAYLLEHLLVLGGMALVITVPAMWFSKRRRPPADKGLLVNSHTNYPGNF